MKRRGNSHGRGVLRVMLDSNAFDRLDGDGEAASELENRGDLRPIITEVQLAQLGAIPDPDKRSRYLGLADRLCAVVSAAASPAVDAGRRGSAAQGLEEPNRPEPDRHEADRMIAAAAAARCDLLVSDDRGLLEHAKRAGLRAMDWDMFCARMVFGSRR